MMLKNGYSAEKARHTDVIFNRQPVIALHPGPALQGLLQSLITYTDRHYNLTQPLAKLKLQEAVEALVIQDERIGDWLFNDDKLSRADLIMFMEKNYKFNIPIEKFAELSGRSISTFQRECQLLLSMKATSWLKKRRLQEGLRLLKSGLPASHVYLSVGFEDLFHFSRSFKKGICHIAIPC